MSTSIVPANNMSAYYGDTKMALLQSLLYWRSSSGGWETHEDLEIIYE
jgi:hypothetical protein